MYSPDRDAGTPPPPPPGRESNRNARYAYLVGRLRNRQITMEEASELFNLMQGMLQTSEAARLALMRTPSAPAAQPTAPAVIHPMAGPSAPGGGDDILLVALLAMGAGAGLLAAMTKRIQDATPSAGTSSSSNPAPAARKG